MGLGLPCSPEVDANRLSMAELLCLVFGSRVWLVNLPFTCTC